VSNATVMSVGVL